MDYNIFKDKNGLTYLLDHDNFTAVVIKSKKAKGDILIPFAIQNGDHEYLIKSIGKEAFRVNKKIKSISFPENSMVQTIETHAFYSSSIVSIKIPESLTKIGSHSFFCSTLESIEIPPNSNLEIIEEWAFGSSKIRSFKIPPKLRELKEKVFYNCEFLQIIDHYSHCELYSIDASAFLLSGLEVLNIPPHLEKLNGYWCEGIKKLKKIIVSPQNKNFCFLDGNYLVGKSDKYNQVYDILYFVNREIEEIIIPTQIRIIGNNAISNCHKVKSIKFNENSECCCFEEFSFSCSSIESISIPPKVTVFQNGTFYKCKKLKTIEIPLNSELQKICKKAFNSTKIKSLYFPPKLKELESSWCKKTIELNEIKISKENSNFIFFNNNFLYGKTDQNGEIFDILYFTRRDIDYEVLFIPPFTKRIAPYSFDNCYSLNIININTNLQLKTIDKYAFYYCNLINIYLPPSLMTIGKKAFAENHDLCYVHVSKSSCLKKIDFSAFENTSITYFYFPSTLTEVKDNAFFLSNIQKVDFGPSIQLKSIDNSVFTHSLIENIEIPSSVLTIDCDAFASCERLKYVEFKPDSNLSIIENGAFGNSGLTCFTIPDKTIKIKKYAFNFSMDLIAFEILGECHCVEIHKDAFYGVSNCFSLFAHKTVIIKLIDN